MKRDYTMINGQINWHTKASYLDLLGSTDDKGKGDVVNVPATKENIIDAIGCILYVDYDTNPHELSIEALTHRAKRLGYIF